jgi:para-aminobenzoate synthetase
LFIVKILLVNNDSDSWSALHDLCKRCDWEVTAIHHKELLTATVSEFDLVILSGGWWYDDEVELLTEYAAELQLINTSPIPVLGICIGMQLMHVALDQAVPLLDSPQSGFRNIQLTASGQKLFGLPDTIRVFKNHTRGVIEVDPEFERLAHSPGHVEIMLHRQRQLLGVQFHPESEDDPARAEQLLKTLTGALLEYRP